MNVIHPEKTNAQIVWTILNLASAILALITAACSGERSGANIALERVTGISVMTVETATVPDEVVAVGTLRAAETSQLAAQMMGNILQIRVREGERVHRGQLLAVIDDALPRAAFDRAAAADLAAQHELSAAEADFSFAEATLHRYQILYDKKSVSPQEFDEIKARFQAAQARREMARAGQSQAKAALQQARTTLAYSQILAPFDGLVTEKKVDSGALANPGTPIFTLEDFRKYRLEASVNETDFQYVHPGQPVPVHIDALGDRQVQGKVVEIVPASDPASRSFLVKIELPFDPALRSGLFGRVQFRRADRTALLIPRAAVVERGQLQGIYVLDQNRIAGLRYITLGKPTAEQIEVLAGLQAGEMLVADPGSRELSGKKIELR